MEVIKPNPGVISCFSVETGGVWSHSYLSNGFIEPNGTFVEREYQAAKAKNRCDYVRILACERPFGLGGAKRLGREVEKRPD